MSCDRLTTSRAGAGPWLPAALLMALLHCTPAPRPALAPPPQVTPPAPQSQRSASFAALQTLVSHLRGGDHQYLLFEAAPASAASTRDLDGHPFSPRKIYLRDHQSLLALLSDPSNFQPAAIAPACAAPPELALTAEERAEAYTFLFALSCGALRVAGPAAQQTLPLTPAGVRALRERLQRPPADAGDPPLRNVPLIVVGTPQVQGEQDPQALRTLILSHLPELLRCYRLALVTQPELEGRVQLRLLLSPSGSVRTSEVQAATTQAPPLEACLGAVPRPWRFPSTQGVTQVIINLALLPDVR